MEELNEEEKKSLDDILENVGKTLILTLKAIEAPNFIEANYFCEGENYKLRIEKIKTS